ncbi:MAG: FliH/SctL family protein [Terriglobales bacterium]
MNMSSSAPKLQRERAAVLPAAELHEERSDEKTIKASPFCYVEAQPGGDVSGLTPEQAAEQRNHRQVAEALERGREAGRQELRSSVDDALARSREQVRQTLAVFATERASYYRRVEGEVVQLALAIARKILHREAQLDPHLLAGIVRVTLEKLDAGTKIDLHVPARETTEWRHYFACQVEGTPVPEVHEDAALAPGECRIETSLGSTEVGLESQIKEIETGLLDLLAERPEDGTTSIPASSGSSASPKR